MKKYLFLSGFLLSLSACTQLPKTTLVPITKPCITALPQSPNYPIINTEVPPQQKLQQLLTISILKDNYIEQLKNILITCKGE